MEPAILIDVLETPPKHIAAKHRIRKLKARSSTLLYLEFDRDCTVEQQCTWDRSMYVIQGLLKLEAPPTSLVAHKGSALFIPANLPHRIEAIEDTYVLDFSNPADDPPENRYSLREAGADSEANVGREELDRTYHPTDVAALQALQSLSPDYFKIIQEFGLGNLWQRPTLSPKEKELVVLSTLITQSGTDNQFRQHVHTAFRRGLTLEEILESIILLTVYVGVPRTLNAMEAVQTALRERI